VRDKVPPELFTTAYSNPVSGNPQAVRGNLREALRLFKEAGYEVRNERLVNSKTGEPFAFEFLADDPSFERVFLFYKPSLDRLGVTVTVRTVDDAQYQNRLRNRDFDIITNSWGESLSPGNEQRGYWGSQAADQPGSFNLIGIKNPAVDAMIDQVEPLCRTAMDLWQSAHRPLGPLRPSRSDAEIRRVRIPDRVVVGCRESGKDRKPAVILVHRAIALLSPPPCGEGLGVGVGVARLLRRLALPSTYVPALPTPLPSLPHKGGRIIHCRR
jgi:hypothetical protein